MLCNLKAELVRKNLVPEHAVKMSLGCTDKTARAKLSGESDFSITEAIKIVNDYFPDDGFQYEVLFENRNVGLIFKFKQRFVAEKSEFTEQEFSNLLNGRKRMDVSYVNRICFALGVQPNDLFLRMSDSEKTA